jgi:hypothetical protein
VAFFVRVSSHAYRSTALVLVAVMARLIATAIIIDILVFMVYSSYIFEWIDGEMGEAS